MKISLNWLKDFVDIKKTPQELSALLSAKLTEVEGFVDQAQKYAGIICVRIDTLEKHSNSDHLWLVKVFDGTKTLDIVCGAQNLAVGQIVPLMPVGSRIIRGQKSDGMLASGKELGLNDDHSGIHILDNKIKPGTPLFEALGLNDVIFDIENKALTHRGDCFSHLGIAREVAAITNQKLKNKNLTLPSHKAHNDVDLKINIENNRDCPRYLAAYIKNVKIAPSPKYIQDRLQASGMRPINNLVDFTNYVMLETGQPLHAFDATKLCRGRHAKPCPPATDEQFHLGVRRARQNEILTTLDGQDQKLTTDNIVITSDDEPVAVAGVMGGASSEISEQTTAVILEAANFDHFAIRKSSRVLGLRTEASLRYEKNLDPNLVEHGMAAILDLVDKNRAGETVKVVDNYPQPIKPKTIEITSNFINARLGFDLELKQANAILESLGLTTLQVKEKTSQKLVVTVPTFRRDLNIPEDLIEEIARIYGYEKIRPQLPLRDLTPVRLTTSQELERELRSLLKELGYNEVYNYSFVEESDGSQLEIVNPLSPELRYIRSSLIPGLLTKVEYNSHYFDHFKLFEIGKEIHKTSDTTLPEERLVLAAAYYNKKATDSELLFRQAKGDLEVVLNKFKVGFGDNIATIKLSNQQTIIFELNLKELFKLTAERQLVIKEVPNFPPIIEDLSFFTKSETKIGEIIDAIQKTSLLIIAVGVFDVYRNKSKKSVALRLTYQNSQKPLSDQDVTPIRQQIINLLESKYQLEVRRS